VPLTRPSGTLSHGERALYEPISKYGSSGPRHVKKRPRAHRDLTSSQKHPSNRPDEVRQDGFGASLAPESAGFEVGRTSGAAGFSSAAFLMYFEGSE
jgi:hypothetical protein